MTMKKKAQGPSEGKAATPRLPVYPPEVEANREAYARVGAHLRDLLNLDSTSVGDVLDITPPGVMMDEHDAHIIYRAVRGHVESLFEDLHNNHDDDFWTTLYVELRLYYDKCRPRLNTAAAGEGDA